jgi:hypothetical protein
LLCSEVEDEKKIVLSGDGCHDSIGHSAKYCGYSLFCHDPLNAIIDFSLVQVGIVLLLARYIKIGTHCVHVVSLGIGNCYSL